MLDQVWGGGEQLDALQMGVRASAMFFILLVLVRVGGARTFGKKSAFDNVVVIMLGAVAARGVVGASPFGSAVVAAAVMVGLHRLLAYLCVKVAWLDTLLKGKRVALWADGKLLTRHLGLTTISKSDLLESARLELQRPNLDASEEAFMERNGRISFVKRPTTRPGAA